MSIDRERGLNSVEPHNLRQASRRIDPPVVRRAGQPALHHHHQRWHSRRVAPALSSKLGISVAMCAGLALTYLGLPAGGPVAIYRTAAIGVALTLALGIWAEIRSVRSLLRTDFVMFAALFGLTLIEFFFPQDYVAQVVTAESATRGIEALFIGFAGLIIGRHFAVKNDTIVQGPIVSWGPQTLFKVFVGVLCLGFFYMLTTVDFNPVELIQQMLRPRFSQPWSRGKLGGWVDIVGEFSGSLLYLVPAIAGAILARSKQFNSPQKLTVLCGLALTFFYAFSLGTRNVFCIYVLTFVCSYIALTQKISWKRVITIFIIVGLSLYLASYYMLQFRTVGLEGYVQGDTNRGFHGETLYVDNNLPVISQLIMVFPSRFQYLGIEFATFALLHPVPRALWPGKPEGLSVTAEQALGLGSYGLTLVIDLCRRILHDGRLSNDLNCGPFIWLACGIGGIDLGPI